MNKQPRVEIYVQARMGSTRLPGKVLKEVQGRPLLEYLFERLSGVKEADGLVVLTSVLEQDDIIEAVCEKQGIRTFRGSEKDVLGRYYHAAEKYKPDAIVRITADCPLIDPRVVDTGIRLYRQGFPEKDYISNTLERTFPRGMDVEIFSAEVLSRMYFSAQSPDEREHVTLYIGKHLSLFRSQQFKATSNYSHYRVTVDTSLDFDLAQKIIEHFYPHNPLFSLEELISLLKAHPEWPSLDN